MESGRTEPDDPQYDSDGNDYRRRCQGYQSERAETYAERACSQGLRGKGIRVPEPEHMREIERVVLLKVIDAKWMDHIDDMDQLRQGIGLQAYGQRDPKVEYKMIGYEMFDEMTRSIEEDTVRTILHVKLEQKVEREQVAKVTEPIRMIRECVSLRNVQKRKYIRTIHARAEVERNTNSAADVRTRFIEI